MRYREATWREEIEEYETVYENSRGAFIENSIKHNQKKNKDYYPDSGTLKRWHKIFDGNRVREVEQYAKKVKSFNDRMYREVADTYKQLTEQSSKWMDNFSTGAGMIVEEYLKASNTADIVSICKLYNEGTFDQLINEGREKLKLQKEEDEKNKLSTDSNAGSVDVNNVQEKQPIDTNAANLAAATNAANNELDGHVESGELQNGVIIDALRTKPVAHTNPEI